MALACEESIKKNYGLKSNFFKKIFCLAPQTFSLAFIKLSASFFIYTTETLTGLCM